MPALVAIGKDNFVIQENTVVNYDGSNKKAAATVHFFTNAVDQLAGFQLKNNYRATNSITFQILKNKGISKEAYEIKVSKKRINITAGDDAGLFYAIQTLLQYLPAIRTNAVLNIPTMQVKDSPRFKWRGVMLDVSRHFFGPEMIKEYIDLMATYKLNRFHWHLVDDPGWRIEIKKYPELTRTGAWRVDHTNLIWNKRPQALPGEQATYGGYYTQQQIKEIIAYAEARHVTIVPEIEMPGHSAAAIASYPWLSCSQLPQLPVTGGNYDNMSSNYCPGNDSVFVFLQNVLSEVMSLFPSKYIHIGGDEVDKGAWKKCPKCQSRMKLKGLKSEEELQSYFINRIEKFVNSKNRKIIGWDEILEGGLSPNATVMSWRGEAGGIEAAKMNHEVVMTPGSPCYLDHYQAGPEGEPIAIGGMNTLKKVYDYEPIPKELDEKQAKLVLGAQGNLWTEFITQAEHIEYMLLPRILALSEVLWSAPNQKEWIGFSKRVKSHFKRFDQKGLHYCSGNFKVLIKPEANAGRLSASLFTEALEASIHYTTDGSIPDLNSPLYNKPIAINNSLTLKAVSVVDGKTNALQTSEQQFNMHKAIGREVTYVNNFSPFYAADGPNTLTDGIRGTKDHSKYWHGFNGTDLIATIDLGKQTELHHLSIACLQNYRSWIFLPASVSFEGSADGVIFEKIATIPNNIPATDMEILTKVFQTELPGKNFRYLRVKALSIPSIPKGHPGEGKPGWLFADEIVVD